MARAKAFGPQKDPRQTLMRPRTTEELVAAVLRVGTAYDGEPLYIRFYIDQLDAETGGLTSRAQDAIHEALAARWGGAVAAESFGLPTPPRAGGRATAAAIGAEARAWLARAGGEAAAAGGAAAATGAVEERSAVVHATPAAPEWARADIRRLTTVSPQREAQLRRQVAAFKHHLRSWPTFPVDLLRPFDEWSQVDGVLHASRAEFVAQGWLRDDPLLATLHLDRLIALCQAEGAWVNRFPDVPFRADVLEGLFYQAGDEPKQTLRAILLRSHGGRGTRIDGKRVDTMGTELAAVPGYLAAGAAGALRSAPFGVLDGAAGALEDRSVEYLQRMGVREDEARRRVATSSFIGEVAGHVAQTRGVVAGSKGAAKHADKALRAADKLQSLVSKAELTAAALDAWRRYRAVFDVLWKTLDDLAAKHSALRADALDDATVGAALLDRALKEALSLLGQGATRTGDQAALRRYERSRSGKDLARYLARTVLRRAAVNGVKAVVTTAKDCLAAPGPFAAELRARLPRVVLRVVAATIRESAVDALKAVTGMDDLVVEWAIDLLSKHVQSALTADLEWLGAGRVGEPRYEEADERRMRSGA